MGLLFLSTLRLQGPVIRSKPTDHTASEPSTGVSGLLGKLMAAFAEVVFAFVNHHRATATEH